MVIESQEVDDKMSPLPIEGDEKDNFISMPYPGIHINNNSQDEISEIPELGNIRMSKFLVLKIN